MALRIVDLVFQVMYYLLLARIILSFIKHNPYHPILRFIYEITEPILKPFRRLSIPIGAVSLDLSPLFAIFVLQLVKMIVIQLLSNFVF